jgi:uncharacterized protein YbjT (DUF2867 family)
MHVILAANGHIGSVVAQNLLERGEPVTIVLHSDSSAADWKQRGARVAIADIHDTRALTKIFREGLRLYLLNPPAPPSTDTAREERKTVASILAALDESPIEKVVAESAYGAQPGDRVGDLGVLFELEQQLGKRSIPSSIIRGAYYLSNWDAALSAAREQGTLQTFYPPDFVLPMVAPRDIGIVAARLMTEPTTSSGMTYVEGPARYSSRDVASAFSKALRREVHAVETPPERWESTLRSMGFSEPAAQSFAAMNSATLQGKFPDVAEVTRGSTTLQAYIDELVARVAPVPRG